MYGARVEQTRECSPDVVIQQGCKAARHWSPLTPFQPIPSPLPPSSAHLVLPRVPTSYLPAPLQSQSLTNYFADALVAEARRDSRIVGIHAAMGGGTGMNRFEKVREDRLMVLQWAVLLVMLFGWVDLCVVWWGDMWGVGVGVGMGRIGLQSRRWFGSQGARGLQVGVGCASQVEQLEGTRHARRGNAEVGGLHLHAGATLHPLPPTADLKPCHHLAPTLTRHHPPIATHTQPTPLNPCCRGPAGVPRPHL